MKELTITELLLLCKAEQEKGNGGKKILISNDDEGNGYHSLFYSFSETKEMFDGDFPPFLPYGVTKEQVEKDYIVLG